VVRSEDEDSMRTEAAGMNRSPSCPLSVHLPRDHLDVTPVDPSTFDLFSDPTTCAKSCLAGLTAEEQATALERANKHGMIQLALHHHRLAEQEKTAHHHHHAHGKAPKKQH
jgi:hypothetical protein